MNLSKAELLADCKLSPYWWDEVPRPVLNDVRLPEAVDVVVIGAGYTGLHAALQTARGGRSTLVFDSEAAGWGCSSRNGGQVSTSIKPSFDLLCRRHGPKLAFDIIKEGQRSLEWIGQFIREEGIDCDFLPVGRFHAAHNPAQYEALAQRVAGQPKGLEVRAHMVAKAEQHSELGTDAYHGGAVYEQHCSVNPARYHQGLLQKALAAGVEVAAYCPVTTLARQAQGFLVGTPQGSVRARNVIVATNGYTGAITPWLQRRVIPIGSYMIATEELSPGLMDRLIPKNRIVSDTRKVVYYYRASPDRKRIVFGGRVSHGETNPLVSGPRLHEDMVALFPELRDVRISHSWCGFVAYTFDELMHVGEHDGLHYAMGYCGAGVGTSSYFGMRVGQQVLGLPEGLTAFDGLAFQTRPLYTGDPWFLAPSVAYYRWRDRQPV